MSRFLFVVPPFVGHVNPTIAVGAELARRGHDVAWSGIPGVVEELLPVGSRFLPAAPEEDGLHFDSLFQQFRKLRGPASFKFMWYDALLPLARTMIDGVQAAVEDFGADALVVDQHALAGAVVARKVGLPWATSATTCAEFVDALAGWPVVAAGLRTARVELQLDAGIAAEIAHEGDILFSPYLVLAFATEALVAPGQSFPSHYQFVGPSTTGRPETAGFPWSWLDPTRPAVLVSLGTITGREGGRFFGAAAEALGAMPIQAVIVADPDLVPDPPDNVLVRRRVPQLALLPHMQAVVSHAGHNTVCEGLALGLPQVVLPIRDGQPVVADQVVRAGCGVRLSFERVSADELRSAIERALTDPSLRARADDIRRSFAAAGGPAGAAEHLEKVAGVLPSAA